MHKIFSQLSQSQLKQDVFVLFETEFKRNGYFVEFGATNGISLSNTYLLEKHFGWTGILAEPATCWHDELLKNRSCAIELSAVYPISNQIVEFNQTLDQGLSTIAAYTESGNGKDTRANGIKYSVNTISLMDLLAKYAAPKTIDYLSIDTEGSELDILLNFDFDQYDIKIITCEHNYTDNRQRLFDLFTSKGYVRKYADYTEFDDWYVKL